MEVTPKQEKMSRFYYNLNRFQECMKAYEEALRNVQIANRHLEKCEKNEFGLSSIEVGEKKQAWGKVHMTNTKMTNDKLLAAETAFKNIQSLLLEGVAQR